MQKGIIINDYGHLKIMNHSFRNFMLSVVEKDEALKMEFEARKTGAWSQFRTPLLLVILALGIFIFATQQGAFNNIVTFLGSFSAALMVGFRLYDAITTKHNKAPEVS